VLIAGLAVVLVAVLLWSEFRGWRLGVWLTKPAASACFVALAVHLGAGRSSYGLWILGGLLACWLGDVLLIADRTGAFRAGIVSFLTGHLLYSVAFLQHGVRAGWVVMAALPMTAMAWAIGRPLTSRVPSPLKRAVRAYIVVISMMLALGVGAWGTSREAVFLVAPSGFYLSDLAVARDRFVRPGFINRWLGLPLYYGAQLLFAWSVTVR
jgi:uncharacterized membrane protein YhhN